MVYTGDHGWLGRAVRVGVAVGVAAVVGVVGAVLDVMSRLATLEASVVTLAFVGYGAPVEDFAVREHGLLGLTPSRGWWRKVVAAVVGLPWARLR